MIARPQAGPFSRATDRHTGYRRIVVEPQFAASALLLIAGILRDFMEIEARQEATCRTKVMI